VLGGGGGGGVVVVGGGGVGFQARKKFSRKEKGRREWGKIRSTKRGEIPAWGGARPESVFEALKRLRTKRGTGGKRCLEDIVRGVKENKGGIEWRKSWKSCTGKGFGGWD